MNYYVEKLQSQWITGDLKKDLKLDLKFLSFRIKLFIISTSPQTWLRVLKINFSIKIIIENNFQLGI